MDGYLRQLRGAPPSGLLDGLDDRVMNALALRRRETGIAKRFVVLSAIVSLGGGALAGGSMNEQAASARPLSPFAPAMALAPSALLDSQ
jgi:hypothetical protein